MWPVFPPPLPPCCLLTAPEATHGSFAPASLLGTLATDLPGCSDLAMSGLGLGLGLAFSSRPFTPFSQRVDSMYFYFYCLLLSVTHFWNRSSLRSEICACLVQGGRPSTVDEQALGDCRGNEGAKDRRNLPVYVPLPGPIRKCRCSLLGPCGAQGLSLLGPPHVFWPLGEPAPLPPWPRPPAKS